MHLFHTPQSSIQNRNVHISVLNGGLWDMEQVHSGICEWGQLGGCITKKIHLNICLNQHEVCNMAPDWLIAVLPANYNPISFDYDVV